ncbi:hypothetical protein [Streptomyces sp. ISL-100]|uniref:hypothetical protein n=1 Tax=Streptomyces sp. ISL-100 TaxID=2819173 RepID=UPI001BE614C9|nr:hypothetical protein [Streptomyces sp. ISL-100]MBT2401912.1 hypothetical protein [Streptomyces sp. ISL-100]
MQDRSSASVTFYNEAPDSSQPGFTLSKPVVQSCMRLNVIQNRSGRYSFLGVGATDDLATLTLYSDTNCQSPVYVTKLDKTIEGTAINPPTGGDTSNAGYASARITR